MPKRTKLNKRCDFFPASHLGRPAEFSVQTAPGGMSGGGNGNAAQAHRGTDDWEEMNAAHCEAHF